MPVAPIVRGPRDVPDLREWMLVEWSPPNAFSKAAERMVLGRASRDDAMTAIVWNLQQLALSELWYVDEQMTQLVQDSSVELPPVILREELIPASPALVVFEKPLVGTDADAHFAGREVKVDGMMWADAVLKKAGPCVGITLYSRMSLDEGVGPDQMQQAAPLIMEVGEELAAQGGGRREGDRRAMSLHGELWVPLGTTHWKLGADWSERVEVADLDESTHQSMAEDRRWLATLWALAMEPKVATLREDLGHRGDRRRAQRAGKPAPTVQVVSLRKTVRPHDPAGTGRGLSVRFPVRGHWRQQPYGPGRKYRRPQFIAGYVKGPDDAPLKKGAVVKVLRP